MVDPIAKGFPDAELTELNSEADEVATVIEFTIGYQAAIQRVEVRMLPSGDAAIGVRISTNPDLTLRRLRRQRTKFWSTATLRSPTCPASQMTAVRAIRATTRATTEQEEDQTGPDHRDPGEISTEDARSTSRRSHSTPQRSTAAHGRSTAVGAATLSMRWLNSRPTLAI